jgi:putative salt-induced outer membrane protein YdiY
MEAILSEVMGRHVLSNLFRREILILGLMAFSFRTDLTWAEGWESAINIGLTATSGNSQTSTVNGSLETKLEKPDLIVRAAASATYGHSGSQTSADKSNAFAQYSYLFTDRFTGNVNFGYDRDRIVDLVWRFYTGPGVGYFFIKGDQATLIGEMGVSYFREKYERTQAADYYVLRIAERGEWKVTNTFRFWETAEYLPVTNDFSEKYIVKAEAGVETAITPLTRLRFLVQDYYNSFPPSGRKKNDVTYIAAVGVKF